MDKCTGIFNLFDDDSVEVKLPFMSAWDIMFDDGRNEIETNKFVEDMDNFLRPGKRYKITIEEIGDAIDSSKA